ncbi:MAG: SDR family NAD(P)-dependent oxidoreductase [Gammaproteobacteria bacterium]|nr:SDR family NAD(P)-dependent oxidoreductase [Gammaproteobacteria bacterium]
MSTLRTFTQARVAVIGASGGIGSAFVEALQVDPAIERIFAFSRSNVAWEDNKTESGFIDLSDEASIRAAAETASREGPLDLVIVATGILHHGDSLQPEKTLTELDPDMMLEVLRANTVGPAIVAKHFLPILPRDRKSVFAALSARVGSIKDNRLGGWSSYRASKSALNMLIKTLSIEHARRFGKSAVVALHPGTVDTALSKPFSRRVPDGQLFTSAKAAEHLLEVIDTVTPELTGAFLAWDGRRIDY